MDVIEIVLQDGAEEFLFEDAPALVEGGERSAGKGDGRVNGVGYQPLDKCSQSADPVYDISMAQG